MRKLVWLGLFVCASCRFALFPTQPTRGELGHFTFGYDSAVGRGLETPVVAGGKISLVIEFDGEAARVTDAVSTDPTIASLDVKDNGFGRYTLHALAPGSTEIEVRASTVTDRVRVTVEAPDAAAFVRGDWLGAAGPTVLVDAPERYWVRLSHGGHPLAGTGATQFTYTGPLAASNESLVPSDSVPDSEENFAVGTMAGSATITAVSGAASAVLPVIVVDASALTGVEVAAAPSHTSGCVSFVVTPMAGATPVYGATCTWPATSTIARDLSCLAPAAAPSFLDAGGWTASTAGTCYRACAPIPASATCQLTPGGPTVNVTIPR